MPHKSECVLGARDQLQERMLCFKAAAGAEITGYIVLLTHLTQDETA